MKKFMKNCAIFALVLIVLGMGMAFTAGAIKGPGALIDAADFIDSGIGGDIVNGLKGLDSGVRFNIDDNIAFDIGYPTHTGNIEQTFSADEVDSLKVEAGACFLTMKESEDGDFHVNVENAGGYQGYVKSGNLCIRGISKTTVGIEAQSCVIQLFVPSNFLFEEMELFLGAGQISANADLSADNMQIELGAGEIILDSLTANELEAEVGMGSLEITGDIIETADVECAMGNILLSLVGEETDFNYRLDVAAGDVSIGDRSFGGMAEERDIDNNASKDIGVECAMGSICIDFK